MNEEQHRIDCFWRYCKAHEEELTRNKFKVGEVTARITYARLFKLKIGISLDAYRQSAERRAGEKRQSVSTQL